MPKQLTSTYHYYLHLLAPSIAIILLPGFSLYAGNGNWLSICLFIAVILLRTYFLVHWRMVSFTSTSIIASSLFSENVIPIEKIVSITPHALTLSSTPTYTINYVNDNGKKRKLYFSVDILFIANWKAFKKLLPFNPEDR